ncbi:MAG: hypothetical protein ACOYLX_06240, partial [Burkholderiaceae bacterium]
SGSGYSYRHIYFEARNKCIQAGYQECGPENVGEYRENLNQWCNGETTYQCTIYGKRPSQGRMNRAQKKEYICDRIDSCLAKVVSKGEADISVIQQARDLMDLYKCD